MQTLIAIRAVFRPDAMSLATAGRYLKKEKALYESGAGHRKQPSLIKPYKRRIALLKEEPVHEQMRCAQGGDPREEARQHAHGAEVFVDAFRMVTSVITAAFACGARLNFFLDNSLEITSSSRRSSHRQNSANK